MTAHYDFSHTISYNCAFRGRLTIFCLLVTECQNSTSTMSPENPFILGSKGQRSRSQRLCRSSDITQYRRCCVHKPRWVFPAVMHRRTSSGSDTGFSLRHFPASACRWTLGFLRHGFLHSCECRLFIVGTVVCRISQQRWRWRCRQLRAVGRDRRSAVGPREHQSVRRRPDTGDSDGSRYRCCLG